MKKLKIFIVEDNFFYANLLKSKIEDLRPCEVRVFKTVENAMRIIHEQPDIILLDHNLPDGKGLELLKEIKSTYPNIQCVMISGQSTIDVAIKALKFGATDYLIKGKDDNNENLKKVIDSCELLSGAIKNPKPGFFSNKSFNLSL